MINKVSTIAEKAKNKALQTKDKATYWSKKNKALLVILISFGVITIATFYFEWWGILGILFIKFGLGVKVGTVKTFAKAVAKAGGKKVIATATVGMLIKRHMIDVASKFFAKHSVGRYKKNLTSYFKLIWKDIKNMPLSKKIQRFGASILAVPAFYFFWTKVLGTAVQKIVYALIVPLLTFIWTFITASFNFITNSIVFILEILFLSSLLNALEKFTFGKKFLDLIDYVVGLVGKLLNWINYLLIRLGIDPKAWLIRLSNKFNKWLEDKIDNGLNKVLRVDSRRFRYINGIEKISEKRILFYRKKSDKKVSLWKEIKINFSKKVLKKTNWKDKREKRKQKQIFRKNKTIVERRKNAIEKKLKKRVAITLPYQELVKYGEVPGRAK